MNYEHALTTRKSRLWANMIFDKIIHSFKFYLQELLTNKRSVIYSLAGAILALGAPIGWEVISYFKEAYELNIDLYYYLFFSTLFVFTIFGFTVGHFHDQVKALADSDPLTGLLNQVSFYKIVSYLYLLAMRMFDDNYFCMLTTITNYNSA